MNFQTLDVPGIILITPKILKDNRGFFFESFRKDLLEKKLGFKTNFLQINQSQSKQNVLRGLHYQDNPFAQSKLVSVIKGSIMDIAVDIRKNSKFYGQHISVELSENNHKSLYIPKGFAHGFLALEDNTIVNYCVDSYFNPLYDKGIRFDDPNININWKIDKTDLIISNKDLSLPLLGETEHE